MFEIIHRILQIENQRNTDSAVLTHTVVSIRIHLLTDINAILQTNATTVQIRKIVLRMELFILHIHRNIQFSPNGYADKIGTFL